MAPRRSKRRQSAPQPSPEGDGRNPADVPSSPPPASTDVEADAPGSSSSSRSKKRRTAAAAATTTTTRATRGRRGRSSGSAASSGPPSTPPPPAPAEVEADATPGSSSPSSRSKATGRTRTSRRRAARGGPSDAEEDDAVVEADAPGSAPSTSSSRSKKTKERAPPARRGRRGGKSSDPPEEEGGDAGGERSEDPPRFVVHEPDDEEDDDGGGNGEEDGTGGFQFSQQMPEQSQSLPPPRPNERANLNALNGATKDKAVTDLSRLLLFKALSNEPIDRLKSVRDALADLKTERVTSAVFDEASKRLRDVFGFELSRVPDFMVDALPARFKDRYYVVNGARDAEDGGHSLALHGVHPDAAIGRGVLMLVLAFAFCKGNPKNDGSRWIAADDLYRLLNGVDENVPAEPPSVDRKGDRKSPAASSSSSSPATPSSGRRGGGGGGGGVSQTPNIDSLLDRFVHADYLLRKKVAPTGTAAAAASSSSTDGTGIEYAMGPRSALEIGRKQIIYFCAEILDEEPDPTMLAEIEDHEEEEGEEEEEVGEGAD